MAVKKAKKVVAVTLGQPLASSLGGYKPPATPKAPASGAYVASAPAPPVPVSNPTPSIEADTGYASQVAAINKSRADALTALTAQEGATKRGYGIEDTSDPFSKAAMLQQSLQRNQRSSTNGLAAAGQLYSGALQNSQNNNQSNYNENYDSLKKSYDAALAAIKQQRATVETSADGQIGDAQGDALTRAIAARPAASDLAADGASPSSGAVPANLPSKPKAGYGFVQASGSRAGKSYNVLIEHGKRYRLYEGEKTPVLAS
jgi:hypothetical protein